MSTVLSSISSGRLTGLLGRVGAVIGMSALVALASAGDGRCGERPALDGLHPLGVPRITTAEWASYTAAFLENGRIVDRENGGQSHSEGQGYGLLLAVEANDPARFAEIWQFTRERLQVREDALLAWRWRPDTRPHVADANNATDGDILVAYALLRAAAEWGEHQYLVEADRIVDDIGARLIASVDGRPVLKPAAFGFDAIPGNAGPVVNPSYYIYSAAQLFDVVRPGYRWAEVLGGGLALTEQARFGPFGLVPDWVSVSRGGVEVARGLAAETGYNAVRIPLYLALARRPAAELAPFDEAWNVRGSGYPLRYDHARGRLLGEMREPGYRMIAALTACIVRGVPIPDAVARFRPTTYFASTLHLIALAAARRDYPACLSSHRPAVASAAVGRPAVNGALPPIRMARLSAPVPAVPRPQRRARSLLRAPEDRGLVDVSLSFSDQIMRQAWLPRR